ncbi:MAG: phosphoribosylformylglycinamidine cyclo-ligase, partial [Pelagibacterales bacterium]|nr:phosphoribosylformylglycinamidine cyclo-ligase [Pelagibacterales bacterium]
ITGGGLIDNLPRIIPKSLTSVIYGKNIKPNKVFHWLKNIGNVESTEMLKTFNCGIGMCIIVQANKANQVVQNFIKQGEKASIIGKLEDKTNNRDLIIVDEYKIWDR